MSMASEKLDEKAIFNIARTIESPDARDEYLHHACGADAQLLERVMILLHAYEEHASFLESPPASGSPADAPAVIEQPGDTIGPYKLLQQIGEGGMGVVFMAEQNEPIHRTVALKIIKPGMDTRQVIVRFEAERQALAMMEHPHIAKVLDAGTTGSGRPFFAMELVKGVPITHFCDERQLPLRERLELFLPVCHAVQHAHQKGLIHRDIKPTNVLVAEYDSRAVPKVIDFGVAKATAQRLTERTMFTEFGQVIGTVEYMSPEQAKLNQLDVDTRSDIYSLGVLLYELLTGSTPFERSLLREAALDEVLRIIREEEPPKPSTKLSTSDALPSIAANRHTEPARLNKDVSGELDWIVMKALEKDRNRRYETASSFAADIQRHLNDEPVQACPPSAAYRIRKFARRNKSALAAITTLAASLVLTIAILAISNIWVAAERDQKAAALRDKEVALQNESAASSRAEAEAQRALAEEQKSREYLYTAHLTMADEAYHSAQISRAIQLLEGQRPEPGGKDLRGFEWYYLWQACHQGHYLTLRGHKGAVRAVAFSPDGRVVASGGADATVKLWDSTSGHELATLRGHDGTVYAIAFSPDGKQLVSADRAGRLTIWEMPSGKQIAAIHGNSGRIMTVAFSPDGRTIASAGVGEYDTITLWNAATLEAPSALQGSGADDRHLPADVIADADNRKKLLGDKGGDHTVVCSLAFSPDGQTLAAAAAYRALKFWDVNTGQVRTSMQRHRWWVGCVAISPDGNTFATAASDEMPLRIWDLETTTLKQTLPGHSENAWSLAFSPDGTNLASAGQDGNVKLWDLATGRARTYGHIGPVWCVAFSPDGKRLASASVDGSIKLWDVSVSHEQPSLAGPKDAIWALAFSPDGSVLAATPHIYSVALWDAASLKLQGNLQHTSGPPCVAFSRDGKMVAAGAGFDVRLWDFDSGNERFTLRGHTGNVHELAFSRDDRTLASSGNDGTVRLWNTTTGEDVATLEPAEPEWAALPSYRKWTYSLDFTPDGQTLAAASRDGFIRLWDLATRRERLRLEGWCASQDSLSISPDGKLLAALLNTDRTLKFWDVASGEQRAAIGNGKRQSGPDLLGFVFTRDWKTVAVSSSHGVTFWDVPSGRERVTLKWPGDQVHALAFSPDGNLLATGGWEGKVALWRTATEEDVIKQSSRSQLIEAVGEVSPF